MEDLTTTNTKTIDWKAWWSFALVSVIFFHITASTFTSLGIALPFMIEELAWSWSDAGIGFSVLAFMVGITGQVPAWTIQFFGTGATFAMGGVIMAIGFGLLATSTGIHQYFIGAGLAGIGYTLCAIVPGVAVINRCLPHRRSIAIGAYMTIGGLGGVAGPMIVTNVVAMTGSWRMHWWSMAVVSIVLVVLAIITFGGSRDANSDDAQAEKHDEEKHSENVATTDSDWRLRDVLRTPQYYVIVAAMTMTLFIGVTTNSWAPTHMATLGIAAGVAAGAMSAHAFVNAFSRAFGGMLATRVDPKWLLVSALTAEAIGMIALSLADNMIAIVIFAFAEGYGFGMCMFATTMLLVNYYGPKEAPKTIGTMYMITTPAAIGPFLGGVFGQIWGGFAGLFRVCAAVLLVCLVFTALMKPPHASANKKSVGAPSQARSD